jgi:hypothetical protein
VAGIMERGESVVPAERPPTALCAFGGRESRDP